ncbi:LacI family transcriptional regulator, partial [Streptomyces sp. SID5914]|nr:LacI family transcriptional regulator [Streptomyces sp. SID5914]
RLMARLLLRGLDRGTPGDAEAPAPAPSGLILPTTLVHRATA